MAAFNPVYQPDETNEVDGIMLNSHSFHFYAYLFIL